MGNTGFKRIFSYKDISETKYSSFFETNSMDLNRNDIEINQFKNKVCLCVNVSSLNSESINQIQNLINLQNKYKLNNFTILAFPSNSFGNEPGNFNELKEFYYNKMKINFPIFSKMEVNGMHTHSIFKFMKRNSDLFDYNSLSCKPIKKDFCKVKF